MKMMTVTTGVVATATATAIGGSNNVLRRMRMFHQLLVVVATFFVVVVVAVVVGENRHSGGGGCVGFFFVDGFTNNNRNMIHSLFLSTRTRHSRGRGGGKTRTRQQRQHRQQPQQGHHRQRTSFAVSATIQDDNASSFSSSSSSSSNNNNMMWKDFQYERRWYPVMWACDLVLNQPTKVTVFDVDFVVAKISNDGDVIAMEDVCPHKAAALSEGRVTTSGNIQCAYHGWTFDGRTGQCLDIPQIVGVKDVAVHTDEVPTAATTTTTTPTTAAARRKPTFPARSCSKAVPAMVHQEMTYIFWGTAEEALVAPLPPTVEELEGNNDDDNNDDTKFQVSSSVRDMPVDWPIVVSNICDADHGLFAHQAKNFDMYAASKDFAMDVSLDFPNDGTSWTMRTKVDSADKLNEIDKMRRSSLSGADSTNNKKTQKIQNKDGTVKETPWATTYFVAPYHLQMKRVDKKTNKTNFITTFYICPQGVGRTRFMGGAVGKKALPRWLVKLGLDNFLDQDTYLLATQQHHILPEEAKDVREMLRAAPGSSLADKIDSIRWKSMPTRRRLFCLSSPTDALTAKLEKFWDATLLRSPNRITNLLRLDEAGHFLQTPPRSVVLDRKKQVLDISPNHQDVVKNCKKLRKASIIASLLTIMAKILVKTIFLSTTTTTTANGGGGILSVARRINMILKPSIMVGILAVSGAVASITNKIISEYHFKYTEEYRRNDLAKIPKNIWKDV